MLHFTTTMLWIGWEALSITASSLESVLASATSSMVSKPSTEPASQFVNYFGITCLDAGIPKHNSIQDGTGDHRLVEYLAVVTEAASRSRACSVPLCRGSWCYQPSPASSKRTLGYF